MVKHPASYTDCFIPLFAELLQGRANVLDPMAGTGKLARVKEHGYTGRVVCNELEPEWAGGYPVDEWHFGDAAAMTWADSGTFAAVCTSPTYGNRMADHHMARDLSRRLTYRHVLGRPLHPANTGAMQWGEAYRHKHFEIWRECVRVLAPGGLLIVNVSDHIRGGERIAVVAWHRAILVSLGLTLLEDRAIATPRLGYGANRGARVDAEHILVYRHSGGVSAHPFVLAVCHKSIGKFAEVER